MTADYHAFSGVPTEVAGRLYQVPQDTVLREYYVLLVEAAAGAAIHVFTRERAGAAEGPVSMWDGHSLDDLPARLLALVLAGGLELRDKVDALLRDSRVFTELGVVPCPPTPRGAFGHPVRPYSEGPLLRAVVLAL